MLCAQGPMPAAATIERYRSELPGGLVPGNGLLAAVEEARGCGAGATRVKAGYEATGGAAAAADALEALVTAPARP